MKTKQRLLKEAKELKHRLTQINKTVRLMEVKQLKKTAGILKEESGEHNPGMYQEAEAGTQWMSKLNPEVNGIEIYNDGDSRLFVIFDKNTGAISVINDWNGEDFDEVWGSDSDIRPELLAQIGK